MIAPPSSCAARISDQQIELLDARQRGGVAGENVGAGVVDPDVEAAERAPRGRREIANRREVGEIELEDGGAATELADGAPYLVGAAGVRAIGDRDVGARARGGERDRAADPARRAGDEHGTPRERGVSRPSTSLGAILSLSKDRQSAVAFRHERR